MDGQTDRQTDGQTDVGHINLIGGLVTRNPPKNKPCVFAAVTKVITKVANHRRVKLKSVMKFVNSFKVFH